MNTDNSSDKPPTPNPILDTFTGLLIGGLIGPLIGAGVSVLAVVLYFLSWLTILGIPIGYMLLTAGYPHGFLAAWAASAAGGMIGGYRSSRSLPTDPISASTATA